MWNFYVDFFCSGMEEIENCMTNALAGCTQSQRESPMFAQYTAIFDDPHVQMSIDLLCTK